MPIGEFKSHAEIDIEFVCDEYLKCPRVVINKAFEGVKRPSFL